MKHGQLLSGLPLVPLIVALNAFKPRFSYGTKLALESVASRSRTPYRMLAATLSKLKARYSRVRLAPFQSLHDNFFLDKRVSCYAIFTGGSVGKGGQALCCPVDLPERINFSLPLTQQL